MGRRTALRLLGAAGGFIALAGRRNRLLAAEAQPAPSPTISPPIRARIETVRDTLWGEEVLDPYRWMENGKAPEWLPFLKSQTA